MFIRKINYIWAINLLLFIAVVFLGIQQGSKGADISGLENKLEILSIEKQTLSENVFNSGAETKILSQNSDLGFIKPTKIIYVNSIDNVASIR